MPSQDPCELMLSAQGPLSAALTRTPVRLVIEGSVMELSPEHVLPFEASTGLFKYLSS